MWLSTEHAKISWHRKLTRFIPLNALLPIIVHCESALEVYYYIHDAKHVDALLLLLLLLILLLLFMLKNFFAIQTMNICLELIVIICC